MSYEILGSTPALGAKLTAYADPTAAGASRIAMRRSGIDLFVHRDDSPDLRKLAALLLAAADGLESRGPDPERADPDDDDGGIAIKTLVFRCDGLDADSIEEAMAVRKSYPDGVLPDYDGDAEACVLAEVCRAYLDRYGAPDAASARYVNFHRCDDCDREWAALGDSMHDDACPDCGRPYTPYKARAVWSLKSDGGDDGTPDSD